MKNEIVSTRLRSAITQELACSWNRRGYAITDLVHRHPARILHAVHDRTHAGVRYLLLTRMFAFRQGASISVRPSGLIVAILFAVTLAGSPEAAVADTARVRAAIGEILHKVEAATVPAQNYKATVHQTVTRPSSGASAGSAGIDVTLVAEDYQVSCSVSGETRTLRVLSSKQFAVPGATLAEQGGPKITRIGLLTANPLIALRKAAEFPMQELSEDLWHNVACYKVSASDGPVGFVVWVSKGDSTIRRMLIRKEASILFDTTFTYTDWNGLLAPSHVEITSPSDGTKITHDYSGHTF